MPIASDASSAPTDPRVIPAIKPLAAALVSVGVGVWIALGEVDHLLNQILDHGRVWSPNRLTGPTATWNRRTTLDGWAFFHAHRGGSVTTRLVVFGALWLLLALVAATLLALAIGTANSATLTPARRRWALRALTAFVLACVHLVVLIWIDGPPTLLYASTLAVWLALAVVLVTAVSAAVVTRLRRTVGRAPHAAYTHRYSVAVVLPLAVLSLARGPDILEQVPDIQRSWTDPGNGWDCWWAIAVMLVLMVATLFVERRRTHHLWQRTCPLWPDGEHPCDRPGSPECPVRRRQGADPGPLPLLRVWFLGPAVLLLGAVVVDRAGGPVAWWRLVIFCAIPVAIGLISGAMRTLLLRIMTPEVESSLRPQREPISVARFEAAGWLGDVLVGLLPIVAALGAVRAFTGVLLLGGSSWWSVGLLGLGVLVLVALWPVLAWALRRIDGSRPPTRPLGGLLTPGAVDPEMRTARLGRRETLAGRVWDWLLVFTDQWWAWLVLVLSLAVVTWVGLFPVGFAGRLGVIATFQLALGGLSVLVASVVILLQPGGSPEVFWPVKIPFAPVSTLTLLACLAAPLIGHATEVHRIRPYVGAEAGFQPSDRPTLATFFDDWLAAGASCSEPLDSDTGLRVRPMLLYAAEGGGVRAAYWTAASVDAIAAPSARGAAPSDGICRGAFLSSGASGGSVGLSIASVTSTGHAADAVRAIAGPEALGAAADGLVVRDTVFAASGLPMPSLGDRETHGADWADRGTLIEQAWQRLIPGLDAPFLRPHATGTWDWGPAGALVLNSTSTSASCRALISQLRPQGPHLRTCAPGQPAPGSSDLVQCTGQLRVVTAALLTARFPYVTPSGEVACPDAEGVAGESQEQQIVDGGYAENFGVGTLVDLAPQLLQRVRLHNDCVLLIHAWVAHPGCADDGPATDTLVVPQVVYFDNGSGSDLVTTPGGVHLEVLVPPITGLGAKKSLFSARSQLERADRLFASDQLWDGGIADDNLVDAVTAWRRFPVAVVYQLTTPQVTAPLGWVLSDDSMDAMDRAIAAQPKVSGLEPRTTRPAGCVGSSLFGTLNDVRALLPGATTDPARC